MADNYGFKDVRTPAELILAPAKPANRFIVNFNSFQLDLGAKLPLPGTITSTQDITGAIRRSMTMSLEHKSAVQQLSGSLTSVVSQFSSLKQARLSGQTVGSLSIFSETTTNGIPTTSQFLQFSSLGPSQQLPASFQPILNERQEQLMSMAARVALSFNNSKTSGVSVQENYARTPYPLQDELDIPSVPRLAQGGSIAAADSILKDKRRFVVAGVPVASGKPKFWSRVVSTAAMVAPPLFSMAVNQFFKDRNNSGSWSEPTSPYAAQFPYNKVQQTESGHVFELDDTPGAERVHLFHRSGSFIEFHPNGTVVYKNLKDGYSVTMGDHHIKVGGKCHIAVDSHATLYVEGNVDVQSEGNVSVQVKRDFAVYANNISLRAKRNVKLDGSGIDLRYIKFGTSLLTPAAALAAIPNKLDNPLSNPGLYNTKSAAASAYRARMFDAPEETQDFELYTAHIGLQRSLGDIGANDPRQLGGKLTVPDVVVEPPASKPPINYLNFDTYKGVFAYSNNYPLGSTSFKLKDLVDITLAEGVVAPVSSSVNASNMVVASQPAAAVSGALPTVPNYSAFVQKRWTELGNLPNQGRTRRELEENGAKFLRIIAYEIHHGLNGATKDTNVGLWQKVSESTIQDRDPDKLVFLLGNNLVAFVDVIGSLGLPSAAPTWSVHIGYGTVAACSDATQCQGWVKPEEEAL